MTLSHSTKWFAVDDAKIAKITADASGATTTYATAIDVPGIKSVGISGDVTSNELRGDSQRLDQSSKLGGLTLSFEFAKMSLDVMSILAGGAIVDAGTAPAATATYDLLATDTMSYFKFEAMTTGVDSVTGDGHITLHKVILTSFPEIGFAEEDYQTFSVEGAAMPTLGTGSKLLTVKLNETAAAIA